mmetsp:Transcript_22590/g.34844  ORF Transcript_22590/g.34844 Transcript_22590/m.34844 type:complete len:82 (-) Transcript_22590:712-957(-)
MHFVQENLYASAFDPNCERKDPADPYSNCINKDYRDNTNEAPDDASNNCCPQPGAIDFAGDDAGNRFEYLQNVPDQHQHSI